MPDLVSQLERRAERGDVRGATTVLREARAGADRRAATRRRALRLVAAAAATIVIAGGLAVAVDRRDPARPELRAVGGTADALATEGTGSALVWTAGDALFRGDPSTGTVRQFAPLGHNCGTCPILRVGRSLFVGDDNGLQRLDGSGNPTRRIAEGDIVFRSTRDDELFVATRSRLAPLGADVTLIDLNGTVLDGPWQLPAGYELTNPPRATSRGILVQSPPNTFPHSFALWDPRTGAVAPAFGEGGTLIDTFTSPDHSLVAWTNNGCATDACELFITDIETGKTKEISAPKGDVGFLGGGAFSPDGSRLAVFAILDRGDVGGDAGGRRMELVIVDVASSDATRVSRSEDEFGETYGFATWSPNGQWLFFGGIRQVHAHRLGTPDAVALELPAEYSTVAVDESF